MNTTLLRSISIQLFALACAHSATINSGSIVTSYIGNNDTGRLTMQTGSFSLTLDQPFFPLVVRPGCSLSAPTCTYSFSQGIGIDTVPASYIYGSLVYNGTSYSFNGRQPDGYQVLLNLTFVSQSVTVPATTEFDATTGFPLRTVASWPDTPFSVSGTIQLNRQAGASGPAALIFSDSISGSGLARATAESRLTGADTGSTNFAFDAVPEPETGILTGAAVAVILAFVRKRAA